MSTQDDFRQQIEDFLKDQGMGAATLGSQALKDPKFVSDLRRGRSPSLKTIDRVRAWMAAHEATRAADRKPPADGAPADGGPTDAGPTDVEPATGTTPTGVSHRSRHPVLLVVALAASLAAAAGVYFWPTLKPMIGQVVTKVGAPPEVTEAPAPRPEIDDRLAAYERRLAAAEARLKTLEARTQSRPQSRPEPRSEPWRPALEALSRRLNALEAVPVSGPAAGSPDSAAAAARARLAEDISRLAARLEAVEEQPGDAHGLALILAFTRLERAVATQRPYGPALRTFTAVSGAPEDDAEAVRALAALKARAARGILNGRALGRRLGPLLRRAQRAAAMPADAAWWRQSLARLTSIVTIRPRADAGGTAPGALLARAEAAMARGDVAAAEAALAALPDGGRAVVEPWRRAALDHLAVHDALRVLEARSLGRLGRAHAAGDRPPAGGAR